MSTPTGNASFYPATMILKIVTKAKRGPKIVDKEEKYDVEYLDADSRVARQAFKLTKHSDGQVYEVSVRDFGPECNCPHHTYNPNGGPCKHLRAMRVVKLIR